MPQYENDGNISFAGGQNDGLLAHQIGESQYRRGVNVTTRSGALSPRPGFIHKEINVVTEGKAGNLSYGQIFRRGKFQAATAYESDDGTFLIAVISGIIFKINPTTLDAEVISVGEEEDGDRLNQFRRRVNWAHAGRFLVFFDFPHVPVVVEGNEARRSNTDEFEIPSSRIGAPIQGRLAIANQIHEFTLGDPLGGINPNAPITFEEVLAPAGAYLGQVFSLGSQSGNQPITAMGILQVADTATGVGPLIVATKNSVYAYRADLPRSEWDRTAFGRIVLYNAGITGARAFTNQNSDLIFLGGDNQVRSLFVGRTDQQRWENAPISREISPWLTEFAQTELTSVSFVSSYKNYVFVSVGPYRAHARSLENQPVFDYAHGGMAVLELDNVSVLGGDATPVWTGLWTGISPMEMVVLEDGPYIFSKDDGGINRLYFMDETKTYDEFEGQEVDIVSRFYTRNYDFRSPFLDKEIVSIDYALSNVDGALTLLTEYQPGHSSKWSLWKCFKHCAKTSLCNDEECYPSCDLPTLSTHSFRELNLGDPEEKSCDSLTQEESRVMRKLGLRVTVEARNWQIEGIRLRAEIKPETNRPATQQCDVNEQRMIQLIPEPNDWEIHRTGTRGAEWPSMNLIL